MAEILAHIMGEKDGLEKQLLKANWPLKGAKKKGRTL
jgi:hypothetical protein